MLKYGRLVSCAKIVELFWNARGEFFHFVFVPKSLVYVLLGVVFMTCPHSVLESVEFAERDSFFYSPDTEHHFDCFYIVGGVVLWVIYLFHIPYQIYWCKDRKNPPHFTTGRDRQILHYIKISNLFANNMSKRIIANIVDINVKTKHLPILLSRGAYNLGSNYGKGTTLSTCRVSDCCISLSDITDCLPIAKPSKMPPVSRMIV